jgi:hypothetical protein
MKSLSLFGFVTWSVKHREDWGGFYYKPKQLLTNKTCDFITFNSGLSISIFSCLILSGLSVFVESLESSSENHNVSFNVDSGCYSSLKILNLTKSN